MCTFKQKTCLTSCVDWINFLFHLWWWRRIKVQVYCTNVHFVCGPIQMCSLNYWMSIYVCVCVTGLQFQSCTGNGLCRCRKPGASTARTKWEPDLDVFLRRVHIFSNERISCILLYVVRKDTGTAKNGTWLLPRESVHWIYYKTHVEETPVFI